LRRFKGPLTEGFGGPDSRFVMGLFDWLHDADYVQRNPAAGLQSESRRAAGEQAHFLSPEDTAHHCSTIEGLPGEESRDACLARAHDLFE